MTAAVIPCGRWLSASLARCPAPAVRAPRLPNDAGRYIWRCEEHARTEEHDA